MTFAFRIVGLTAAFTLATTSTLPAQFRHDTSGITTDIIGLHRWTATMLRDSIRKFIPGAEIGDAACMVLLRTTLHFPDASVVNLSLTLPGEPTRQFLVVKVVEPGDAWRSNWRTIHTPANWHVPKAYETAADILEDTTHTINAPSILPALQLLSRPENQRTQRMERLSEPQRRETNALWFLLDTQHTADGYNQALRISRNGTTPQRTLAAAVLGRFPDRDSAWEALVEVLRDPSPAVREVAVVALTSMPVRPIPWSAHAVPSLRALLGGTNVGVTESLEQLLMATALPPRFAAPLLRHNGDWLLMLLAAVNGSSSGMTRAFLTYMNHGVDVGSQDKWRDWLARV